MVDKYTIEIGTVRAYLAGPDCFHGFGRCEYDQKKPVLKESTKAHAIPIVVALNKNQITIKDACQKLDTLYWV